MLAELLPSFFSSGLGPDPLLWLQHDPWLVLLSVLVSMGAAAVALHMASLARRANSRGGRLIALASGALALGSGVWTMHYIGMLAFALCGQGSFDPRITVLSVLPSLAASWVALRQLVRPDIPLRRLLGSGVLVGAGIGTMHYIGMEASSVAPMMRYDGPMFLLSIVVAVLLAMLALWIRFGLERHLGHRQLRLTVLSGMVMGGAIAGMHYTGMAALRFVDPIEVLLAAEGGGGAQAPLSVAIAIVTVTFSLLALAVNGGLRYRQLFLSLQRSEQRAEERLRIILDTAADAVVMFDEEGVLRAFNSGAERTFGWQAADVLGRPSALLIPPADRLMEGGREAVHGSLLGRHQRRLLRQRGQAELDMRGFTRSGREFPARLSLGRVPSQGVTLYIAFISDMSLRHTMELALRRSEQQLRALLDNLPGIAFRRQSAEPSMMEFISDGVLEICGRGAEEFLTERISWETLLHPEDLSATQAAIAAALAAEQPYLLHYRIVSATGGVRWVADYGRGVRDEHGVMRWIDGVVLDVSARHAMEEELRAAKVRAEEAAAARASFLANMSHEIRTPMNAIIGFSEAVLESPLEPQQRRQLNTVLQAGRSLLRLLNDILDTAKLDKGAVTLELADFSLHALCRQVFETLRIGAERKGLALTLSLEDSLASHYRGDSLRIQQVLLNLLGNAIKFTEQGEVKLRARAVAERVVISIEDSGIGMSEEQLGRIFDPFSQADATTTRRFGGTGLGTTIALQLIELMGGELKVSSRLGEGSCFEVLLPLAVGAPPPAATASALVERPTGLAILAVDDVDSNLELLEIKLGAQHRLVLASDGAEALAQCRQHDFDLVLMDLQMPGMDGFEATRRIRAREAAEGRPRLPIIALSASVLAEDRSLAAAAGMDGFAAKPLDLPALESEILRVLKLPAAPAPGKSPRQQVAASLPTLDWEAALALWQAPATLLARLQRFVREEGDWQGFAALVEAGAAAELAAAAHRLRGAAANLGLRALQDALGRLEALAGRGADQQALHELIAELPVLWADLEQQLAARSATLAAAPAAAAPVPAAAPAADAAAGGQIGELLAAAAARLREGELPEQALGELQDLLGESRLGRVLAAVDDFDFEQALSALAELAESLAGADHDAAP